MFVVGCYSGGISIRHKIIYQSEMEITQYNLERDLMKQLANKVLSL